MATQQVRRIPATALILGLILLLPNAASAQKSAGLKRFSVDFLTLKSGDQLRGALLGMDGEGIVSMAVQRDWLSERRPRLLAEHVKKEQTDAVRNATLLRDRIKNWLADTTEPLLKIAFLETELERAEESLRKAGSPDGLKTQFVILRIPRADISKSFVQPPQNRQVAMVAWDSKLEDVERREIPDLLKELNEDHDIENPADEAVNLAGRVPPIPESQRNWTVRKAIVDFHYGKKLEFQGMGGALFRTGEGAPKADIAQVLPQLIQSQLSPLGNIGEILGEPGFGPPKPKKTTKGDDFKTAIAAAEKEGLGSFRVTQLDLNPLGQKTTVTQQFVVKMPDGSWKPAWRSQIVENATQARPDLEEQIANDPQVAQIKKILGALGGAQDGQLKMALGFGAATMAAQKAADRNFFEFRDRYVRRLDGPPITLPKSR